MFWKPPIKRHNGATQHHLVPKFSGRAAFHWRFTIFNPKKNHKDVVMKEKKNNMQRCRTLNNG